MSGSLTATPPGPDVAMAASVPDGGDGVPRESKPRLETSLDGVLERPWVGSRPSAVGDSVTAPSSAVPKTTNRHRLVSKEEVADRDRRKQPGGEANPRVKAEKKKKKGGNEAASVVE